MHWLRERLRHWSLSRVKEQSRVRLQRHNIYIFPTWAGGVFLLVALLVLLLGINYQNNLAYAVCFFMLSLLVTAIVFTYANLSGLDVEAEVGEPVFAGEAAGFRYRLASPRTLYRIHVHLLASAAVTVDVQEVAQVHVSLPSEKRGWLEAGALCISTVFPLGLLRAWTWVRLTQRVLVYPTPIEGGALEDLQQRTQKDGQAVTLGAGEDYFGLKAYSQGDAVNRIAWRVLAKGQGLHTKQYQNEQGGQVMLHWDAWPQLAKEARLSRLTYWALVLSKRDVAYGLSLPGVELPPGLGEAHLVQVLESLALFRGES